VGLWCCLEIEWKFWAAARLKYLNCNVNKGLKKARQLSARLPAPATGVFKILWRGESMIPNLSCPN
jgi:hypothetical protein